MATMAGTKSITPWRAPENQIISTLLSSRGAEKLGSPCISRRAYSVTSSSAKGIKASAYRVITCCTARICTTPPSSAASEPGRGPVNTHSPNPPSSSAHASARSRLLSSGSAENTSAYMHINSSA